jgi:hypothetical protein
VVAAERTVEITDEQYNQGAIDFTPVFIFQQTLTEQQDELAVAQGDIALGLIGVYRALGGGWQIRLANSAAMQQPVNPPVIDEIPAPEPVMNDIPFESLLSQPESMKSAAADKAGTKVTRNVPMEPGVSQRDPS